MVIIWLVCVEHDKGIIMPKGLTSLLFKFYFYHFQAVKCLDILIENVYIVINLIIWKLPSGIRDCVQY